MTVDEIIARRWYKDRRGRTWCVEFSGEYRWHHFPSSVRATDNQMRLLIERDLHRGDCPGLRYCESHPVPHVARGWECGFEVWDSGDITDDMPEDFSTLHGAMDAARALAVGE